MSQQPYVRVTLTAAQRRARIRSLAFGLVACGLLLVVLVIAATAWFDGVARAAVAVAALVPLAVAGAAVRGLVVLGRAPQRS